MASIRLGYFIRRRLATPHSGGSARGQFVGVDEAAFPRDFAVFARYDDELLRKVPHSYPLPTPLTLEQLISSFDTNAKRYRIESIPETQPLAA